MSTEKEATVRFLEFKLGYKRLQNQAFQVDTWEELGRRFFLLVVVVADSLGGGVVVKAKSVSNPKN